VTCAKAFGFQLPRIAGDHHIYVHPEIPEIIYPNNIARYRGASCRSMSGFSIAAGISGFHQKSHFRY
jgi:hypothetical protein